MECASVSLSPSLSTSPGISLSLTNARSSPLPSRPADRSIPSLSFSCYSASIDSGMDHLIHPICIPLMLPVGRGMSAPTRRAARVQCRTYGIVYPRSRLLDRPPVEFPQKRSPPDSSRKGVSNPRAKYPRRVSSSTIKQDTGIIGFVLDLSLTHL